MVVSVFLKITLWIRLDYRFNVFLYLDISFLQLDSVCLVIMSRAFFLVFFPMSPRDFIHSLNSNGSCGGFGMFVCWWFCMVWIKGCVRQLGSREVSLMVFLIIWYVDISLFHCFWSFLRR